jgi:hypothetical protein
MIGLHVNLGPDLCLKLCKRHYLETIFQHSQSLIFPLTETPQNCTFGISKRSISKIDIVKNLCICLSHAYKCAVRLLLWS